MYDLIDFVLSIFDKLIDLLNVKFFPDVNITFLQVILIGIGLKFVFKFLFGGFKEIDTSTNYMGSHIGTGVVYKMSNNNRKKDIVNEQKERMVDVYGDGTYLVPWSQMYGKK